MKRKLNKKGVEKLNNLRNSVKDGILRLERLIESIEEYSAISEIRSDVSLILVDSLLNEYDTIKDLSLLLSINSLTEEHWLDISRNMSELYKDYNNLKEVILESRRDCGISEGVYYDLREEMDYKVNTYKECNRTINAFVETFRK